MTFVSEDMTITTWGSVDGNQRWRVRTKDGRVAEFFADRLTEVGLLFDLADQALGGDRVDGDRRCPMCNDEGVVHTHDGQIIGPCECAHSDGGASDADR